MAKNTDQFQQHIHVFRGIAIILIVCAHTVPSLDWSKSLLLGSFLNAIANQSSIFFFFIAGYLFQYLSKGFVFSRYLKQKLRTVIFPYLLLSIPAIVVFTLMTQRVGMWSWFYELPIWGQTGLFLLTGKHLAPLWFVPTISLFYLAAPLFLFVDRRFPLAYWLIVPLLVLSGYLGRGGPLGPLNFAQYLLPFYLLGMVCCHYKDRSLQLIGRFWPLLALIAMGSLFGRALDWPSPPFWQVPFKLCMVLLLTWLLWKYHHVFGSSLDYIADISFGIFFIHAYFIIALKLIAVYLVSGEIYKGVDTTVFDGGLLMYFSYVAVVLLVSVAVIWLTKKVFKKNSRMPIGA
ncbi:acyltransferase [Comamonadaceae bacterium G21597-S1]|nr:acyltransferase [Comamonadaceae bacterium G21597-S1]